MSKANFTARVHNAENGVIVWGFYCAEYAEWVVAPCADKVNALLHPAAYFTEDRFDAECTAFSMAEHRFKDLFPGKSFKRDI